MRRADACFSKGCDFLSSIGKSATASILPHSFRNEPLRKDCVHKAVLPARSERAAHFISVWRWGAETVMAMNLTVPDATAIFKSIKQACEEREAVEIEIGELRWKTDARLRSSDGI